ncbi:LANO_0G10176g1_1 [Lachancea nothofagi CBS 11611]|uniref:LANO_0G10176g1_1 n=1 Tax=Lachancea nothofagi CBS 11611 TaxID=1266666 RepID=A0A1G4KJ73_9SACH|nr:LANO_0G10176g1_1 [Lachancea nothofagi CBS 11611]
MAPSITVVLNPPSNGEFYTLEDIVSGELILELDKPLSIREIVVELNGSSETLVRPGDHLQNGTKTSLQVPLEDSQSLHKLVVIQQSVFPPQNVKTAINGSKKPFKVERGTYTFPFEFRFPDAPQCILTHPENVKTYLKGRQGVRLPPSFNNALDTNKLSNLDAYFYSLGKIEYHVEATVLTGGEETWFKPFRNYPALKTTLEVIPSNLAQDELDDILENGANFPLKVFQSKFDVTFEDDDLRLWAEIRSNQLRSVYRLDYLFRRGCNKFDQVYVLMSSPLPKDSDLRVVSVDLNLIEYVTYLSGGRSNANLNSLRLARSATDYKVDLSKCSTTGDGFTECRIDLADINPLKKVRFNEEDYRHKGNRLYSFTSCNVRRLFKFQLFLRMSLNNVDNFQFEVLTNFTNIFCESVNVEDEPPAYMDEEQLPRYE